MTGARLAWSFLTRLPGGVHPEPGRRMAQALPWFPIVGAVVGALAGGAYVGLSEIVSPTVAAVGALAVGIVVTGGFHEDGLADTADSFGGYDRSRRLEIMRDSRIGTFGTLALVLALLVKVAAVSSFRGSDGLVAFVAAHAVARAAALVTMRLGPEARTDGLAATAGEVPVAALVSAGATVAVAVAAGPATAVAAGLAFAGALVGSAFGRRHLGGVTGDLLGAVEQVGEIVALVAMAELGGSAGWLW